MPAYDTAEDPKRERTKRYSLTEEELDVTDCNVLKSMLRDQSAASEMLSVELAALRLECKALREGVGHTKVAGGNLRSPQASNRERTESCPAHESSSDEGAFLPVRGSATADAPSGFKRRARTLSETSVDNLAGVERIGAGGRKRVEREGRFSGRFDSEASASPASIRPGRPLSPRQAASPLGRAAGGAEASAAAPRATSPTGARSPTMLREELEAPTVEDEEWLMGLLSRRAPFSSLDSQQFRKTVGAMRQVRAQSLHVVAREGEPQRHCFVLASGTIRMETQDGQHAEELRRGAIFGELGLLYDVRSGYSATAIGQCVLWTLDRAVFQRSLRLEAITRRRERLEFLRSAPIFAEYRRDARLLGRITDVLELAAFAEDEVIIREGDEAHSMYFVQSGQVVVTQQTNFVSKTISRELGEPQPQHKVVAVVKRGQYFGERALLTGEVRAATVSAMTDVECLRIDRAAFELLLGPIKRTLSELMPSQGSPLLARKGSLAAAVAPSSLRSESDGGASPQDLRAAAAPAARSPVTVPASFLDSALPTRRDYEASLTLPPEERHTLEARARKACATDSFSAALAVAPRPAASPAAAPAPAPAARETRDSTRARRLSQSKLDATLPPSEAQLAPKIEGFTRYEPPKFSSLRFGKLLGAGGFGRVEIARDEVARVYYAMKIITKRKLLQYKADVRTEWLLRERRALCELSHPFVVKLFGTYQDDEHVFLLLELAIGGELFRIMDRLVELPEAMSRFYAGSLVLALQAIHALEYVYRDLKPENVLITAFGFVKLCDFGFAKRVEDRTYTQCGTPDYVAPEMLKGQGVNQAADWWALGVLIYEMLVGVTPFCDQDDEMKTFENILKGEVNLSDKPNLTERAREILGGLLCPKLSARLGYLKGGASDVIGHAWFEGFDWDGLINLTIEPPWRPKPAAADDLRYFDAGDEDDAANYSPGGKVQPESTKYQHVWDEFGPQDCKRMSALRMSRLGNFHPKLAPAPAASGDDCRPAPVVPPDDDGATNGSQE